MDAFKLRGEVVANYSDYISSFLNILDDRIKLFLDTKLAEGVLWPEPLLQLSPAYEAAGTIEELVSQNILHPLCSRLFRADGKSLRLYKHQRTAIEIAEQGHNYVVTTGTGSGKSLTYLIPIINYILQHQPEKGKVRAIIVYPMNALINSQEQALNNFVKNLGSDNCPIRYKRYTGQESDTEKRAIQENPPHILLTNYVMLELMLTRPEERAFVDSASSALQFLVLDELHTYRGRQGADVALLVRRLRERCGNQQLQCIGTSATMSSGETRTERARAVAQVATKIFGAAVSLEHVVDETLRWGISQATDPTSQELTKALNSPLSPSLNWEELKQNPLATWIEKTFGLREDADGKLRRREPVTLWQGAQQLAELTGLTASTCATRLQMLFNYGSQVKSPENNPGFAFKLHQFFSQGGAIYSTIEAPDKRYLTLEGQHYAPGEDTEKLLYPIVFCRECGQEYYLCTYHTDKGAVIPRPPFPRDEQNTTEVIDGYLLVDAAGVWSEENTDLLPETWFKELKRGRELKKEYAAYKPRRLKVSTAGTLLANENQQNLISWFMPTPFLTCLRCGEVYTKRQVSDFGKLSRLSSEGRSTATTLLVLSAVKQMQQDGSLDKTAQKLLSFTDNRQDASLQAGHFNDFIEVALLRSAIFKALTKNTVGLDHTQVAGAVVTELGLTEETYAVEASPGGIGPLARRNQKVLQELIEYRIYEDLRRGWRVNQPNLEQCGLLLVDYDSLEEVCQSEKLWQGHAVLAETTPEIRLGVVRAILDYMRRELAISAECLEPDNQEALKKRVRIALKEPWTFDENEFLYSSTRFVQPGVPVSGQGERSFGPNTSLGRYLRSCNTWPTLTKNLDTAEYLILAKSLVEVLRKTGFLVEVAGAEGKAVQLRSDSLIWKVGDRNALMRDPVRTRRMNLAYERNSNPNRFFAKFYQETAASLQGIEGREHTGQVVQKLREAREQKFREGNLAALFCSPTMELGIDISNLNAVHLRNVPPTPANYAQRSGRAGRSGQPAFVASYCSIGSGHDQYYFRRPERMVAGVVAPPRLDLGNEELVSAHVHAIWLAVTGLKLGRSMIEVVDTAALTNNFPLRSEVALSIELKAEQVEKCLKTCQSILRTDEQDLAQTGWYSEEWLKNVITAAAQAFDLACERWRELYTAAERQLQEARADIDRRYQQRTADSDIEEAKRRESEALKQKDLLCNTGQDGETDFYPYRYFASEGFLPGYNFPRLPVQAFLSTGKESGTFLSRPRFLALTEFGPRNVIYHEGRKYRVTRTILPAGSAQQRLITAKLCNSCGYFHDSPTTVELCEQCGTQMDGSNSLTTDKLFEMTTMATQRIERITSEEEERTRQGYHITTHYRFPPGNRSIHATARDEGEEALIHLCYAPAATLWRVNHRWRRSTVPGFTLDLKRGIWAKRPGDEDDEALGTDQQQVLSGVRVLVRDTRNLLLVKPEDNSEDSFLASLQYALQRGIEAIFQVEEQELASERIGERTHRQILFWEAAEGGVGVLNRIVKDEKTLAEVAKAALEICHFDPLTGQEKPEEVKDCGRACYRCLLSYSNQPDHPLLNRYLVRDFLLKLVNGTTKDSDSQSLTSFEGQQLGAFAAKVYAHLKTSGRKLPDKYQPILDGVGITPDFYYSGAYICLFCIDDYTPIDLKVVKNELEDSGYRVLIINQADNLESQLTQLDTWLG